jgi:hypothetical protein
MLRFERRVVRLAAVLGIVCFLVPRGVSLSYGDEGSEWKTPFQTDEHTVVLYHFDEGKGNEAYDACGDAALTLRAHRAALWGSHSGFGTTARFARRADDADLRVGPTNNDKLHLKTCTEAWTVEAWVRYTGLGGQEQGGRTYANICGTDDEGFGLREGRRGGHSFTLMLSRGGVGKLKDGLLPTGRFIASSHSTENFGTSDFLFPYRWPNKVKGRHIADDKWHHVAWQFRYKDQLNTFFLDGQRMASISLYNRGSPGVIVNNTENICVPFVVGGWIHSQDPPFYIKSGNFQGEIDELRISNVLRYPVARKLAIVRQKLPNAGLKIPYSVDLTTDAAESQVGWEMLAGSLPEGMALDGKRGVIHGIPTEEVVNRTVTIEATDAAGHTDKHTFSLTVVHGRLVTQSLRPAFAGSPYQAALETTHLAKPIRWEVVSGTLPKGIALNSATGQLDGAAAEEGSTHVTIQVTDINGLRDTSDMIMRVLPQKLRVIKADANTVVLYNWQGPNGKLIPDVMGDKNLTLTWTAMGGDRRVSWPGRRGRFPQDNGHGEHGWVTKVKGNPILDLKTCRDEWTVEAWVRRGGPIQAYGKKVDKTHQPFDYGHICGSYDNSKRGVWELYLSDHDSPDGSMAPGVHFLGAKPDQALMNLHPWKRPQGIVGNLKEVGIRDTEWHHVAWQYNYAKDLHQLFLDGKLIWQMQSPDGHKLVNNRKHAAQFSVSTRLTGDVLYGVNNFLGFGNFFGQIGEIRISNTRRY